LYNFSPPQQAAARFGSFTVHYDEWSEYIDPTVYSIHLQQRIQNWDNFRNLRFSGDGLTYMRCIQLYHTSERAIVIGDNLVFLYSPRVVFTPETPHRTLFSMTHVSYTVVHINDALFYFDRQEVLYNYVDMDPLFMKIKCPYVGTYILFVQVPDQGQSLPTIPSPSPYQHPSTSNRNLSGHQRVRPGPPQQQSSSNVSSSPRPSTNNARTSSTTALGVIPDVLQSGALAPPLNYDSDDSQVKKKTKVASVEWHGKTFFVTGKESALNILRDTFSVRTLMEEGQLQHLVHHVGDFVNNYTPEVFKTGIIRRHS